ncbi:hypothetical protein [Pseudomonas sp. DWRC2-2]|uniref:hypothetical protein n=1 Tax=Pseudomonas sp. DWRC2-2 TaxID=2804567 RepID=UPI003CF01C8E
MSLQETIAVLTGKLVFEIDSGPLRRFTDMLASSQKQMAMMAKQADAFSVKLNRAFGVKQNSAQRTKLDADLRRSLDKELSAELKLSRLKRSNVATQLASQKLVATGKREEVFLQGAALKQQVTSAVLAAKQYRSQQEALKVDLGKQKLQAGLEQSKLREARLADLLQRRQERTLQLQQQQSLQQNKFQRAELALVAARERGARLAERHNFSKAASSLRESRAAARAEQVAGRYTMATERHEAWKARQVEPQSMGLGSLTIGLGTAGAALYGLVGAVSYLGERIKARQEGVVETQSFDNLFKGISKNQEIGKSYREAFIKAQNDNGSAIDIDTGKDFRTLAMNMAAAGKTQKQILDTWNTRQQAFTVAGNSRQDNQELNKQMGQMAADGTGAASDANIINNRMPMLVPYVVREFMKEHGIKDYAKGLAQYNKDLKGGKGVKSVWYEEGMRNLVADNAEALERNRNSVASQQQRADNQVYLNTNQINASDELSRTISERIQAERDLNMAMVPLQNTIATLEVGLIKLNTVILRLLSGRDANGAEKSQAQQLQDRMSTNDMAVDTSMVGVGDYSKIDGGTQHQGGWIGELYNKLFNVKDYRANTPESRDTWKDVGFDQEHAPWSITPPALDLSRLNTKGLPDFNKHLEQLLSQSDPSNAVARLAAGAAATASRAAPGSRGEMSSDEPPVRGGTVVNNTTNSTATAPTTVTNNINVNVRTDADANEIAKVVTDKIFGEYLPKENK